MKSSTKSVALAITGALALSVSSIAAQAADNPFAMESLSSGYQVADNHKGAEGKCGEGKCGEGKCGGNK